MVNNEISVKLYDSIRAANEPRVMEHWHASSIAECPRAQFYKRLGMPGLTEPSAAKMIRWNAGHLLEESIRPHIAKLYKDTTYNTRFTSEKMDLTGEYDNYSQTQETIIEIKSVHDMAFIEREGQVTLKDKVGTKKWGSREVAVYEPKPTPYLHHELQEHAYVLLLKENNLPVKFIDYVYISLSGRIVAYHTEVQNLLLGKVEQRLANLSQVWKDKILPPCVCTPDNVLYGPVLQWCDYRQDGKACCDGELFNKFKGGK